MLVCLLAWMLVQALALQHRVAHGASGAPHEVHALGGEHHDDDAQCRLIDQAGWGDVAPGLVAAPAAAPADTAKVAGGVAQSAPRAPCRRYQARAPPPG